MPLDPVGFDLREVFLRLREEMLADLAVGSLLRHGTSTGNSAERAWLNLLEKFLPGRYRAGPGFVVDAEGKRSRQIDIVIYDGVQTPAVFPHSSGLHVPVETVYAVIEVKSAVGHREITNARLKAASVRSLKRKPDQSIVCGLVAGTSCWTGETFQKQIIDTATYQTSDERLDLGCILKEGAFEWNRRNLRFSSADESLAHFVVRLSERLRALPDAEPVDLMRYGWGIKSLK